MRRAAKIDNNQKEIVNALKAVFASVHSLASVGDGCPDLLVGFRGKNYLIEIKQDQKTSKLRPNQVDWHQSWMGQVAVVRTSNEALKVITDGQYQFKDEQLVLLDANKDEEDAKQLETYLAAAVKKPGADVSKKKFWYHNRRTHKK